MNFQAASKQATVDYTPIERALAPYFTESGINDFRDTVFSGILYRPGDKSAVEIYKTVPGKITVPNDGVASADKPLPASIYAFRDPAPEAKQVERRNFLNVHAMLVGAGLVDKSFNGDFAAKFAKLAEPPESPAFAKARVPEAAPAVLAS